MESSAQKSDRGWHAGHGTWNTGSVGKAEAGRHAKLKLRVLLFAGQSQFRFN